MNTTKAHNAVDRVAQALVDAHTKAWGGSPVALDEHCDSGYWRKLAAAVIAAGDEESEPSKP